MDISKLVLRDPPEKRVTQVSSSSLPKGSVGSVFLLILFRSPFKFLEVKFFFPFDIIHSIPLSREAVASPRARSFSVTTQTESSPPPLPAKSHSLSSSFVR